MNKERRTRIIDAIRRIESLVQDIHDEEQNAYDNMPDSLQGSYNGITSEEALENLESAIDALEEAVSYLEDI